jgi:hypothetical protein
MHSKLSGYTIVSVNLKQLYFLFFPSKARKPRSLKRETSVNIPCKIFDFFHD